ncbi:hypothetical protein [uncultured Prevotellamassilia sp.]|uniref:hypothetical protein n=1 Tax=uncultured Prevotellamassilia sp. TaxID=1926676 RepID=UPI002595758D|nr:hypothetical protein [uncultured Prevotellamassilia sp.]
MTKKQYTSPRSEAVAFFTESLMTTTSMAQHDDVELGGADALGNSKSWSSEGWADED